MENQNSITPWNDLPQEYLPESFTFHSDPGHGWLMVPTALLKELGIERAITTCSYISWNNKFVYLEEDCDVSTFMAHYENYSGLSRADVYQRCNDSYMDDSPVRKLRRYQS